MVSRIGLLLTLLGLSLAGCKTEVDDEVIRPTATVSIDATGVAGKEVVEDPLPPETVYLPLTSGSQLTSEPQISPATATSEPTQTPAYPIYEGPTIDRRDIGVQIHLHREDLSLIMDHLQALGVGWVKLQVSWKLYQPYRDAYSEERFTELDRLVAAAVSRDISVLLSVSKAPEWSRPTTEMDGPPNESTTFQEFLKLLAGRYRGRVAAYELWNEPNLRREWNGVPLSAADFVALTRIGAAGIRAVDPQATVISGAPAPTGINDGVEAIDDRIYFREMLDAGIGDVVDAIGAHPYGWANPPESSFGNPAPGVPSHADHPSFFFQDTLLDYQAIANSFGVDKQIWVTEFGWGSFEGFDQPPPPGAEFMAAVSERQQAAYVQRAFALAQGWDWVGPMMLWNLNFGPLLGQQFAESGYSLLGPDGRQRPVYAAMAAIPKR